MKKCNYLKAKMILSASVVVSAMLSMTSSLNASTNTVDGNFSVLTYNIGALPWPAYNHGTAGNPDGRVQEIGERINTFDIVGVQEQFSVIDEFREGTRFPYFSENKHLYSGGSGIDLLSKYPMIKTVKVTFDDHPWYVNKGFTKNTVMIYPDVFIDVYNHHTGDSDDTVLAQHVELSQYIQDNTPSGRAVIVIGDFNAKPTHWHPFKDSLMTPNNLKDAWTEFGVNQNPWQAPVDRVLYRDGDDLTLTLDHYETIDVQSKDSFPLPTDKYQGHFIKSDGSRLSDHPAVLAEFKFTIADDKRLHSGDTLYLSQMKLDYGYNNGFDHGPFGINQTIGGGDEWDGQALRMDPKTYAKGIGTHALSRIFVNTDKKYSRFISDVGIDEETGTKGRARFKVFANATETNTGTLVFDSGSMAPWSATKTVDIDISNVDSLKLVVDPEDSDSWDHANWADARFILK
ncbi:NPCBM/NEW2 domain-containing protein [Lentisphaerota bacterium WC36G]|nr:NPCBM/NEW2 domain-containing protein [Lentisphaerae bacterium WC36]